MQPVWDNRAGGSNAAFSIALLFSIPLTDLKLVGDSVVYSKEDVCSTASTCRPVLPCSQLVGTDSFNAEDDVGHVISVFRAVPKGLHSTETNVDDGGEDARCAASTSIPVPISLQLAGADGVDAVDDVYWL